MKTLTTFALLAVMAAPVIAQDPEPDCEDVTWVDRTSTVMVECKQIISVPETNCVEVVQVYQEPIDADCEPGNEPAPDGSEPGDKECGPVQWVQKSKVVKIQCTTEHLRIITTCEPRTVTWKEPVDSPNCVPTPQPLPQTQSAVPQPVPDARVNAAPVAPGCIECQPAPRVGVLHRIKQRICTPQGCQPRVIVYGKVR